jgi:serine/threonine protein phosphatase 1
MEWKSRPMSLTYAIADLHGRFDLLKMALESIASHAADGEHKIVTLGDYVDRGPDSRLVIQHLMEAQAGGRPLICLKGNHEDLMHTTLTAPLDPEWWARNGGEATLKSYNNEVPTNHLDWVKNLPTMYVDRHRVFVHAGIDPTKALDDQTEEFLLWHRYPENADIDHIGRHLVHGHTPNPHGPEQYQNRTNLDTLAWRTGRLVVAVFDDERPGPAIEYVEVESSPRR